jgi:hypothetical protein
VGPHVLSLYQQNSNKMKKVIFKSEKKAKVYEIRSAKNQGIYKAGELIRTVKTDNINELLNDGQYQVTATEIKVA